VASIPPEENALKKNVLRWVAGATMTAALVAAASPAGASGPTAHESLQCGSASTSNGGVAAYINAIRVSCPRARKVARHARGQKRYSASGFTCRRHKPSPGTSSPIYDCRNGNKDIGFTYHKP
jgi:hypothetical protein